jgi:hypothetical protein
MHCSLFIPDFFSAGNPAPANRLACAETLIAKGRRKRKPPTAPETWLLERFGVSPQRGSAVAPYTLLADGGVPDEHFWMRADPVHLSVGLDGLGFDGAALELARAEADALAGALNRHFVDAPAFHALQPERWYIRLPAAPDVDTTPPRAAKGSAIGDKLPSGADATHFRALMNEVQMVLHEHPVNAEREARGAPSVNSVWFWGGGVLEAPRARACSVVLANDPLARGLAQAARIPDRPLPRDGRAMLAALPAEGVALAVLDSPPDLRLERDWFEPLLAALREGRIDMLSLNLAGNTSLLEVETVRSDLRHFWRARKPLQAWLA